MKTKVFKIVFLSLLLSLLNIKLVFSVNSIDITKYPDENYSLDGKTAIPLGEQILEEVNSQIFSFTDYPSKCKKYAKKGNSTNINPREFYCYAVLAKITQDIQSCSENLEYQQCLKKPENVVETCIKNISETCWQASKNIISLTAISSEQIKVNEFEEHLDKVSNFCQQNQKKVSNTEWLKQDCMNNNKYIQLYCKGECETLYEEYLKSENFNNSLQPKFYCYNNKVDGKKKSDFCRKYQSLIDNKKQKCDIMIDNNCLIIK